MTNRALNASHRSTQRLAAGLLIAASSLCAAQSASAALSAKVSGNHLVDASGKTLQLRGVSVGGLEFVAVQGWDASNPWGNQTGTATPNWSTIKAWNANTVRIPLNEASWLGLTCKDSSGASHKADPGANYRSTVASAVSQANSAGMYVILDLAWTAPGSACPLTQNAMADADHSTAFWSSVAAQFKSNPSVLFELFSEPFVTGNSQWPTVMKGGAQSSYITGGNPWTVNYNWNTAGMQSLVNAVRATGASNVVLVGAPNWSQDLSGWLGNRVTDSARQLAASWHPYPDSNTVGDPNAALPSYGSTAYTWVQSILDAGYPVIISETGDHNAAGTKSSPLMQNLLPWADARSVSYVGASWDTWGDSDNILIKNASGTPTDGYGTYFKAHLTCIAAANCTSAGTTTPTTPTPPTTPTTGTGTPSSSAFWVYRNGTYNWGGDYSVAVNLNYRSSAGTPQQSYDLAVSLKGQWGLWLPYAGGTVPLWNFDASPYKYFTVDLKPTVANQSWQFYFIQVGDKPIIGSNGKQVFVNLASYGPAPVVGKWATYKIPLTAVLTQYSSGKAVYQTSVYKFGLQDETGKTQNTWYVDNAGFTN